MLEAGDLVGWMRARGITAQVVPLLEASPTVVLAARALGVEPDRVLKSLVFMVDGAPCLVVARGTARVDPGRLARALGARGARLAGPAEVEAATGYRVGEMPPFGHLKAMPTLVDRGVVEGAGEEVYAGAGRLDAMLRLSVPELLRATAARVVDVVGAAARG